MYLCVLYGSEKKQRLFPYTALTGWFLKPRFNPLQPSGHYTHASITVKNSTFCPHSVFMCFGCIWEKTAIISLYSINWLGFFNRDLTLYSPVVTICTASLTFTIIRSAHTVYLCVLCVSEKKQRLFPYTALTDWGFFNRDLTVYSPVVTICTASLTSNNSTFCPHSVFMCFVWISEQTAIISLYNINWLVCTYNLYEKCLQRGMDWVFK